MELPQGKKLKCSTSQAKHKLFIGNVPRNWGEEDMKKIVNKVGPGVIAVELLKVKLLFLFDIVFDHSIIWYCITVITYFCCLPICSFFILLGPAKLKSEPWVCIH